VSATATVSKEEDLTKDPAVKEVLEMTRTTNDIGAVEAVLMELALLDLYRHRNTLRAVGAAAVKDTPTVSKRFLRAVETTRLNTGLEIPGLVHKEDWIKIPAYDRKDGTSVEEHKRRKPERGTKEWEDLIAELEEVRAFQRGQEKLTPLENLDGFAQRLLTKANNEKYSGAIKSFLEKNSLGEGIVNTAKFLSELPSRFQFMMKAVSQFGLITGTRLAYAYFRWGGYDVPLTVNKKGELATEFGDTLPEVVSQKKTRMWAIEVLTKRLPNESANKSGAEPPSEGFIIDSKGNIIAHAVGRGNDHYLPFNTKHLRKMRQEEGVEYVRRRMFGGPTVEDLSAAMMMGADRLTIVSNGGTYTIELTKRSHGLKMEHFQVLTRFEELVKARDGALNFDAYNNILDAMQSEFPLHFKKDFAKSGAWKEANDRIRPKVSFIAQLRALFDEFVGTAPKQSQHDVQGSLLDIRRTKDGILWLPGQTPGQSPRDAARDLLKDGYDPGSVYLSARRVLESRNANVNVEWMVRLKEQAQREAGQKPTETVQTSPYRDPNAGNPGASKVAPFGSPVVERKVDQYQTQALEAQQRARPVTPSDSGQILFSTAARKRFEEQFPGIELQKYKPSEVETVRRFAAIANNEDLWEKTLDNKETLNEIGRIFRYGQG
jgi:hypothetical protein